MEFISFIDRSLATRRYGSWPRSPVTSPMAKYALSRKTAAGYATTLRRKCVLYAYQDVRRFDDRAHFIPLLQIEGTDARFRDGCDNRSAAGQSDFYLAVDSPRLQPRHFTSEYVAGAQLRPFYTFADHDFRCF